MKKKVFLMDFYKLNDKMDRLQQIYDLFDKIIRQFDICCSEKCDTCCTCNVAVTGLEAKAMVSGFSSEEKQAAVDRVRAATDIRRFQPELTTNMFARYCVEGRQVPDEKNDPGWGKCPLLNAKLCSVYKGRPFGCRAMISQIKCEESGIAQIPDFALTLQNIFMQAIEQLDEGGIYGNLIDIFPLAADHPGKIPVTGQMSFARNEKIKVLMVPPEHRGKASPVIKAISDIIR